MDNILPLDKLSQLDPSKQISDSPRGEKYDAPKSKSETPSEIYEKENPTNLRPFEDIHAKLSPAKPSIKPISFRDVLN